MEGAPCTVRRVLLGKSNLGGQELRKEGLGDSEERLC